MITDPKTTVRSRKGQCLVAFWVAVAELLLRLNSCVFAPLYALFWVGPAALLLEMAIDSRSIRKVPIARAAGSEAARS
jgi:enediyne biosynthesis protein E5